jgi:hypothetical protein
MGAWQPERPLHLTSASQTAESPAGEFLALFQREAADKSRSAGGLDLSEIETFSR